MTTTSLSLVSAFAALVRKTGVEDAAELVALATTDQLVTAFDEDLFANPRPGERETFDARRFAIWLEVLVEAGDALAARKVTELSLDFVVHAFNQMVVVFDQQAVLERAATNPRTARRVDHAMENALCEELDGYLLVSRKHDGWDAMLAVILALDRDHREFLVRVLDRCAVADIDDAEHLAEADAEAEREDRRAALGYVEPRAAKAFLASAREDRGGHGGPPHRGQSIDVRDPLTRAYFRELVVQPTMIALPPGQREAHAPRLPAPMSPVLEALQTLPERVVDERMRELAYLANVLIAGATIDGRRYSPAEATDAVLTTIARALDRRGAVDIDAIGATLSRVEADRLFREGYGASG